MPDISKKKNRPIGVFDSGMGGLSILPELRAILPHENFVFLADQLYVPYGEKSKKELDNLTSKITDYFIKNHHIKMMVIACNTATCSSIEYLRNKYSFPIVGTVPAIKPAAEKTKSKTIAVISTPFTSKSSAVQNLIKNYCSGIKVLNIGCKNLEDVVEEGELNSRAVNDLLLKYLKKIKNSPADYLVLGCTHYPFLKKPIIKILGRNVKLLDGGKAIARQTRTLLKTHHGLSKSKKRGEASYLTTSDSVKFSKVASKLLGEHVIAKKVAI